MRRRYLPLLLAVLGAAAPARAARAQQSDSSLVKQIRQDLDSIARDKTAPSYSKRAQLRIATEANAILANVDRVDTVKVVQVRVDTVYLQKGSTDTVVTKPDTVKPPPAPAPQLFVVPAGLGSSVAKVADLPRDTAATPYPAASSTVKVPAGADLQLILNTAKPGDEIRLAPGSVYTGEYSLPRHTGAGIASCSGWITLRTDVDDAQLGAPGTRMTPSRAAAVKLAQLRAPGNQQAIGTALGADNVGCWRLTGLEILPGPTGFDVNGLVRMGDYNTSDSTKQAHHIVLDRSYVHGVQQIPAGVNPSVQGWKGSIRRCVAFYSRWNVVVDSWVEWCRGGNGDAQAVLAYPGTGPYRISNSHLSGGTEVIMFGGAHSAIVGAVPSDVTIHGNVITRELADTLTLVKNLLETKCVEYLDAAGNVMRLNWPNGQVGYGVLLKSVNQSSGSSTWCRSRHVTVRYNRLEQSAEGFNLAGIQEGPAQSAGPYTVYHNVIGPLGFRGGEGHPFQVLGGGSLFDLTIANNSSQGGAWGAIYLIGLTQRGAITGNLLPCGEYGVKGDQAGSGSSALAATAQPYVFTGNALWGCADPGNYPAGTTFSSSMPTTGGAQLGTILDRVEVPR